MIKDRKVQLLLVAGLVAYVSLVNPTMLPDSVKEIVNNTYVKIAVLVLIGLRAHYDVTTAILLAVAFVVTLNCANQTEGFANENELPKQPTAFDKKNFQGRFKFLTEGKDNDAAISQIRSLFIPEGWTVVAYPKRRFKGNPTSYEGQMFIQEIKMKSLFVKKGPMKLADWDLLS